MMAKKQLDKLTLDMIQCEKDGYGVHYGRWKATQPIVKPVLDGLPEGWKVCPHCGKEFKPKLPQQKYCDASCCNEANNEKYRLKRAAYLKAYKARRKEELKNESYA